MLWKILRPRWWLVRRQWLGLPRRRKLLTALFALFVLSAGGWLYAKLVAALAGPLGSTALVAVVPGALTGLLFFALIQLADTLYQLYLAPDVAFLLVAPIPPAQLFIAKLLECTQAVWLPAGAIGLILAALGVAQAAPWSFYLWALGLVLALALTATAVSLLLVMGLARLIPPSRLRAWLPAGFAVASLGGILLQQALISQLSRWGGAIQVLAEAVLKPDRLALVAGAAAGLALALVGLASLLFARTYQGAYSELSVVPVQRRGPARGPRPWLARSVEDLAGLFPSEQRLIVAKEWLTLVRDPQRLVNLVLVPLLMAVLLVPMLTDAQTAGGLRTLTFWLLLVYAALFGLNASQGAALTAFLLEGRRLLLLRQTPIALDSVLWAKLWAAYLPAALVWGLVLVVYGGFVGLPAWQSAVLVAATVAGLLSTSAIFLLVGALGADFNVTVAQPKLGSVAVWLSWLGLLLGALAQVALVALTGWLVLTLGASTELVIATRLALSALPAAPWPDWLVPLGALAALAGVGAATSRLWQAARRRLETWEPGQG